MSRRVVCESRRAFWEGRGLEGGPEPGHELSKAGKHMESSGWGQIVRGFGNYIKVLSFIQEAMRNPVHFYVCVPKKT